MQFLSPQRLVCQVVLDPAGGVLIRGPAVLQLCHVCCQREYWMCLLDDVDDLHEIWPRISG